MPSITDLSPSRAAIGATVTITGTGLRSTTAVRFAGSPAAFRIVSSNELSVTVPRTARTGPVEVQNPTGTATSPDPFTVEPNIVLILTDDQRFDELAHMPTVQSTLVDKGVTFHNGFVVNSLCCPSRSTILTGEYSHSTGVYKNSPPNGGFETFTQSGDDRSTIATWLHDAGYRTALIGKYLNGYTPDQASYVPPGWSAWDALTLENLGGDGEGSQGYFDYSLSVDGTLETHGTAPSDYSTDVLASDATEFIRSTPTGQPLFLFFAPRAPHAPATPRPGDARACSDLAPNRPPNYNEANVSDKPSYIASLPTWTSALADREDAFWQRQCQSLYAVDDAVGSIVSALSTTGRLNDTLILFASDNGLAFGEHRWKAKEVPYEESIRVPIVARFDRLTHKTPSVSNDFVLNLDFAPTFAAAAAVEAPGAEGMSFLPLLDGTASTWRKDFLVEFADGPALVPGFCAVRNTRYLYVEYSTGEQELYDLQRDPYELANKASASAYQGVRQTLYARMLKLCSPPPPGFTP
jgi:N-acetylglucosamine-6-sulfatase